jgi:hypothetical protein
MDTYKSAMTLWHYIFTGSAALLRQLAHGWGCGDSGSSQSRGSLSAKLTAKQKTFVLKSGFDLLECFKTAKCLCPFALQVCELHPPPQLEFE